MCFSLPLTIDWVARQVLSLWACPSPFAPAASAWPWNATGGERRGRGGCSGEPAPGLRKKRVPSGQSAGQRRRHPEGSCLSLAALLSAEVCLSPAAWGGGPPCLVSGGGHSGDATVTKMRPASGSRSAHVRGPAGAPQDRAPGLGSWKDPGGSN